MLIDSEGIQTRIEQAALKAVKLWGEDAQIDMMLEEATELSLELIRTKRNRHDVEAILEEMADVYIMLNEMVVIFGKEEFVKKVKQKLIRFEGKLKEYE